VVRKGLVIIQDVLLEGSNLVFRLGNLILIVLNQLLEFSNFFSNFEKVIFLHEDVKLLQDC
jgi:hypothetical protein